MKLEVQNICKSFDTKQVLNGISFCAESGRTFGLLGKNGAGKTTTIRIIMNLFFPDSGKILVDGSEKWNRRKIGYLPEERGLYQDITIAEQLHYIGQLRGMKSSDAKSRAKSLLQELQADQYYSQKMKTLSKGNQQKIQLAVTLIHDPDIIILDEPFSGLDPVNSQILKDKIMNLVKDGKIVIFSSHQMGYVEEFCQNICIIDKGNIVLNGDLRAIKKSYRRNRVLLTPERDGDLRILASKLQEFQHDLNIQHIQNTVTSLQVVILEDAAKDNLFQFIMQSGIPMSELLVLEPTLEEIFIEKAGESK